MMAMYPPNGSYTEILELHTMDETYDDTTANSKYVQQERMLYTAGNNKCFSPPSHCNCSCQ